MQMQYVRTQDEQSTPAFFNLGVIIVVYLKTLNQKRPKLLLLFQ